MNLTSNNAIPAKNKVSDSDMNEIKEVVNENAETLGDLNLLKTTNKSNIVEATNEVLDAITDYTYDSLPVGSVIDYEGTEVPDGYEKVSETEKKVWTNPNPTSSFSSQTINLDIEGFDYDELEIMSYNQVSEKYELYNKIQKLGKGRITDQWAGTVGVGCRSRIFNNNTESTIKFENANNTIGTTAAKTDNEGCVPMQVIARKRGGSI